MAYFVKDISADLLNILEEAEKWAKDSMFMFERYQKTDDNSYWASCMEYDKRARGLLDAYQIITGREVVNILSAIRDEILAYKELFLVR